MGGKKDFLTSPREIKALYTLESPYVQEGNLGTKKGKGGEGHIYYWTNFFCNFFWNCSCSAREGLSVFRYLASHLHCWEAKKAPNVYYSIIPAVNKKRFSFSNKFKEINEIRKKYFLKDRKPDFI